MHELSKSIARRLRDPGFTCHYFSGMGIDIGAGEDSLDSWSELFPRIKSVDSWDRADGDAQLMLSVLDNTYDFVHSSHCLEHMVDPSVALKNWIRICRPGGYIVVMVPDADLYEQGFWPSRFNRDHKHRFSMTRGIDEGCICLPVWLGQSQRELGVQLFRIQLLHETYRWSMPPGKDQTLNAVTESAIEFVLRKD